MEKHYKSYFITLSLIFIFILPNSNNFSESTVQTPLTGLNDHSFLSKTFLKHQQIINPNKTLLPRSNFSVTEFQDGFPNYFYNASIQVINASHWQIACDYSRSLDWEGKEFPNGFSTSVTRSSLNHTFIADNYYNWFGFYQPSFDFWINTSGFFIGHEYSFGQLNMTVINEETISLDGVGSFNAWKVNITFEANLDPMTYWYSKDGLFLSLYFRYFSIFWYNLTTAEIAELSPEYNGPTIGQISPKNNSYISNGSIISIQFFSPYGIDFINYQWDSFENQTSITLQTIIPSENGSHELYIIVKDNIGIFSHFYFLYFTDYTIPGIFLKDFTNNSHIQGSSQIMLVISNGNGSIIFNWNGNGNTTITENTPIIIPNIETEYELNVYINNGVNWASKRFIFSVDNSPPSFSLQNLNNNTVLKGSVRFQIRPSEDCNLTFELNNVVIKSYFAEFNKSYEEKLPELENGTHELIIYAVDEAQNINRTKLTFSIYVSAFNWNWEIKAYIPKTINIINSSGHLWFFLTLTSSIDQYINLSVIPEDSFPTRTDKMEYVIEFNCEKPEEIIYITLTLQLSSKTSEFPEYQWKRWDVESNQWLNITTVYNEISYSWQATYEGYVHHFALVNTGEITSVKSITPGGGQIPSFEVITTLLSLITITIVFYRKKESRKSS
ncbi:MAG: hypothetical protein ACFFB2_07730 [Promethearchaeota archaeon]